MTATKDGDIEKLKRMEKEPCVDFDAQDSNGATALMHSVRKNNLGIVVFLLEKGVNVNAKNKYGKTPLMFAVHSLKHASLLIENNANVNAQETFGNLNSPITIAANFPKDKTSKVVKLLIDNNADVNYKMGNGNTALLLTCRRGNKESALYLACKEGITIVDDQENYFQQSPRQLCAEKGITVPNPNSDECSNMYDDIVVL